jgi:hypothetical protein
MKTEIEIKKDLYHLLNDLEKTLEDIMIDTDNIIKEKYNIHIERLEALLNIPRNDYQHIRKVYQLKFIDKENNIIVEYIWEKILTNTDSSSESHESFKPNTRYLYLLSPSENYLSKLNNYLRNIEIIGRIIANYISSITSPPYIKANITIKAKIYRNDNMVSSHRIAFIKENERTISGIIYNNGENKITIYL